MKKKIKKANEALKALNKITSETTKATQLCLPEKSGKGKVLYEYDDKGRLVKKYEPNYDHTVYYKHDDKYKGGVYKETGKDMLGRASTQYYEPGIRIPHKTITKNDDGSMIYKKSELHEHRDGSSGYHQIKNYKSKDGNIIKDEFTGAYNDDNVKEYDGYAEMRASKGKSDFYVDSNGKTTTEPPKKKKAANQKKSDRKHGILKEAIDLFYDKAMNAETINESTIYIEKAQALEALLDD